MITTESAITRKFREFSHSRHHRAIAAAIRGKFPHKTRSPPERAHSPLSGRFWQAGQCDIRLPHCVKRTVHASRPGDTAFFHRLSFRQTLKERLP